MIKLIIKDYENNIIETKEFEDPKMLFIYLVAFEMYIHCEDFQKRIQDIYEGNEINE